MKFKITVIAILTAILAICAFTSYKLTTEAEKQTQLQLAQAQGITALIEMSDKTAWRETDNYQMEPYIQLMEKGFKSEAYIPVYDPDYRYNEAKDIIENIKKGQK